MNISNEIVKKNKELKGIVGTGTRTKFDAEIKVEEVLQKAR